MSPSSPKPGEAGRLFREGNLADALTAANAAVRKTPTDIGARVLLAELLVFAGNIERADVVLDACADLDPTAALVVAEFRQLLRGETARRQLFSEGRVPEFLGEPTAAHRLSLAAVVALRGGDTHEAGKLAAQAEEARGHPSGTMRGGTFDDMRDGDDLLASCFEVITTTGKYFWIPPQRVVLIEFHPMKRPRDLYWRRCACCSRQRPLRNRGRPVWQCLISEKIRPVCAWPRQFGTHCIRKRRSASSLSSIAIKQPPPPWEPASRDR